MAGSAKEIIITDSGIFSDIDTLACGVAYKNLLDLLNKPSRLVLPGPLNKSVSKTMRSWNYSFETSLKENPHNFSYVLVDISNPNDFAHFVVPENIIEVYDHRWGYEDMWKQKLGTNAKVEVVGACATLIWEEFKKHNMENKIDTVSANLLYTAIFSNTLNFKSQNTTQRDINAFDELAKLVKLPDNWKEFYFNEIEEEVLKNPLEALQNDTKEITIDDITYRIGQIELWDSTKFVTANAESLTKLLEEIGEVQPFITLPSISQGINYILCPQRKTQEKLSKAIGAKFDGSVGKTDKLWLRKEIMRELERL